MPELTIFDHEFRFEHCSLFEHRPPEQWLADLWESSVRLSSPMMSAGGLEIQVSSLDRDDLWRLAVRGTEPALRWVCAALNQHAEQSPSDGTPPGEADRLEATLAGGGEEFVLVVEGRQTNDGRLIPIGATKWRDGSEYPVYGRSPVDGHAVLLGNIVRVWRADAFIVKCAVRWDPDAPRPPEHWRPCADGTINDPCTWSAGGLLVIAEYSLRGATMMPADKWAWA